MSSELLMRAWHYNGKPATKLVAIYIMDSLGEPVQMRDMGLPDYFGRFEESAAEFAGITVLEARAEINTLWHQGFFFVPELWSAEVQKARPAYKKRKISSKIRNSVLERDGYTCQHRGSADDLTIDHIYPESRGGSDDMDNLQVLCHRCNSIKGASLPEEDV